MKTVKIPKSIRRDPIVRRMTAVWGNQLTRFDVIRHRVNPYNPKRAEIERSRTKERQRLAAAIRDVEKDLLKWLASATHHPDLWTDPGDNLSEKEMLDAKTFSKREQLLREWRNNRKRPSQAISNRAEISRKRTSRRHEVAKAIQDLEWQWLSLLFAQVRPSRPLPPRRLINPRIYRP